MDIVKDEPDSFVLIDHELDICWKLVPGPYKHTKERLLSAHTRWFSRELRALRRVRSIGPRNLTPTLIQYGALPDGSVLYLGTELIRDSHHPSLESWPTAFADLASSLCRWHAGNGVTKYRAKSYLEGLHVSASKLAHPPAREAINKVLQYADCMAIEVPNANIYEGLVHGDVGPHNCLQARQSTFIIDWGGSRQTSVLCDLLTAELVLIKNGKTRTSIGAFWNNIYGPDLNAVSGLGGGAGKSFRELLSEIRGDPISEKEFGLNMVVSFANWFIHKATERGEAFVVDRRKTRFFLECLDR